MTSALTVYSTLRSAEFIKDLSRGQDIRMETAGDIETGCWLIRKLSPQLVLVEADYSIEEQTELGKVLWERSFYTPMVVYDLYSRERQDEFVRKLAGAEAAIGPHAPSKILRIFSSLRHITAVNLSESRIAVVDDLDSARSLLCVSIEARGIGEAEGFSSPIQALAALRKDPDRFQCVISDLQMPEMSGEDLINAVREDADLSTIPLIVVSAHGSFDRLISSVKAGATGFLAKPLKLNDLERELQRALRISRNGGDPRLASPERVEELRNHLQNRIALRA